MGSVCPAQTKHMLFQGTLQYHGAPSGLGKGLATVDWHHRAHTREGLGQG